MFRNPDIDFAKLVEQLEGKASLTPEMVLEGKKLEEVPHKAVLKETKEEVQILEYSDLGYCKVKIGEKEEWIEVGKLDFPKLLNETEINEPPAALASLAKKAGKSVKDAERYWQETKKQLLKSTGKKEKDLTSRDYQYIMGVVKKRLGLPTKPLKDSKVLETAKDAYGDEIKVGDKVKVVEPAPESELVGKVFTVVAIEDEDGRANVFVRDEQGNEDYFWADKLEKVSESKSLKEGFFSSELSVLIQDLVEQGKSDAEIIEEVKRRYPQIDSKDVEIYLKGLRSSESKIPKFNEPIHKQMKDLLEADLIAVLSDEQDAKELAQKKKGWYRKDEQTGKFKVYVGESYPDSPRMFEFLSDHWKEFIDREDEELKGLKVGATLVNKKTGDKWKVLKIHRDYVDAENLKTGEKTTIGKTLIATKVIDVEESKKEGGKMYKDISRIIDESLKVFEEREIKEQDEDLRRGAYEFVKKNPPEKTDAIEVRLVDGSVWKLGVAAIVTDHLRYDYVFVNVNDPSVFTFNLYSGGVAAGGISDSYKFSHIQGVTFVGFYEDIKGGTFESKVFEERGKGQGVGGPRQYDGGAKYCYCTRCGYHMEHPRGVPCKDIKCPNCGEYTMIGVNEIPESIKEQDTRSIKVEHPGILEVPAGKKFWQLPLKHYINLAKKKGRAAIARAINNLRRWNKNRAPDIAKKAEELMNRLKANPQWQAITATESISEADAKRYQELAERLFIADYLLNEKKDLTEKERNFIRDLLQVKLSEAEREIVFEKYLDLKEGIEEGRRVEYEIDPDATEDDIQSHLRGVAAVSGVLYDEDEAIIRFLEEKGKATVSEIASGTAIPESEVRRRLKVLQDFGLVRKVR